MCPLGVLFLALNIGSYNYGWLILIKHVYLTKSSVVTHRNLVLLEIDGRVDV